LEEIFLLNARSEILFSAKALGLECTSLLALPEATANGSTLLAQNWDWMPAARDCQVRLEISGRAGIPPIVTFTEAGQLAKIGMNGAGVGLTVNNLASDQPRAGVPWIFITRRILESGSFARALGAVLNAPRAHSMNFVIAHAMGEGANLETAPVDEHVLWAEGGVLAHTNHYLQQSARFRDLKPLWDAYPSTYLRLRRASQGLASARGKIDVGVLQEILRDHMDRPYSVCMHENMELPLVERSATCLSIVMDLTARRIHLAVGNPCEAAYETLDVQRLLDWAG
jgi:isopenicillin-N N-acyltransferase-like protein